MPWPTSYVTPHEPLSNHTSFRIGGPAEWFAQPGTLEELIDTLCNASRLGLSVSVLGGGTNTLIADEGVRGLVLCLARGFRTVDILSDEDEPSVRVRCGAALLTQHLVYLASQHGWGGVEGLAGLPGQIGGAVAMNAQWIGRFVRTVTLVAFDGTVRQFSGTQLEFGYRYTAMEPGIISEVVLEFPRVPIAEAYAAIHATLLYRNSTQDVRLPSAGCAFKNPPGSPAGQLIDRVGLKGCRIGDAQISRRHANFIVNLGQASCDDVLSLMECVQRRVAKGFGIRLEPEVRVLAQRLR